MGLREQKRQRTWETIADTALSLALDRGLDQVTIDDIAEVVVISPRTVSNYFACKEEAVVAGGLRDTQNLLADFTRRALSEPPLESLCELMVNIARARTAEQQRANLRKMEMIRRYPSLQPYEAMQYSRLEGALRETIATRMNAHLDRDVTPWLSAAAAVVAIKYSQAMWVDAGGHPEDMIRCIRVAFAETEEGLASTNVALRRSSTG